MPTSKRVASKASKELQSKKSTKAERSVAASALSGTGKARKAPAKQTTRKTPAKRAANRK
jgi:hypothetical protein